MKNELKINGFSAVADGEMVGVDGGLVMTAAFIGACVVWGVNLGLVTFAVTCCDARK